MIAGRRSWRGIESQRQAEERNDVLLERLRPFATMSGVVQAIERCNPDYGRPCSQPACAVCARSYRIEVIRQLGKLADSNEGACEIATIYLAHCSQGQLQQANLQRIKDSLRKRLVRGGLTGAILAGGIEANWQAQHDRWLLHAHMLAIGVQNEDWSQLEAGWSNSGITYPIDRVGLNDENRQLSYLVKFVTYHRPGSRRGNRPARAYPLPADRLVELTTWLSRYAITDFLFLHGKRRRGRKIVER